MAYSQMGTIPGGGGAENAERGCIYDPIEPLLQVTPNFEGIDIEASIRG